MADDQRTAPGGLPSGPALAMATGTTVTVVAWGILVLAAIDFGRSARTGDGLDWLFLVLATIGAVACMFLAIVLASRMQSMIRLSARSSTRPLPRELQDLPPAGASHGPLRERAANAGKRAVRR